MTGAGLDLVAVQAAITPDTTITFRRLSPDNRGVVTLGDYTARVGLDGSVEDLRRLADVILAGLAGEQS